MVPRKLPIGTDYNGLTFVPAGYMVSMEDSPAAQLGYAAVLSVTSWLYPSNGHQLLANPCESDNDYIDCHAAFISH